MIAGWRDRFLARQFARPSGLVGRYFIGVYLDRLSRTMNRVVFEDLRVSRGDEVLELGFGGGDLLQLLLGASQGKIIGVDISEAMVARARRRFRAEIRAGRLELFAGTAEGLPMPDASVDKVASVNNIYFWPDPERAMREFARTLRPGGALVIALETPESLRAWPGHRFGFNVYDAETVVAMMETAGFRNVAVRTLADPKLGAFHSITGERC